MTFIWLRYQNLAICSLCSAPGQLLGELEEIGLWHIQRALNWICLNNTNKMLNVLNKWRLSLYCFAFVHIIYCVCFVHCFSPVLITLGLVSKPQSKVEEDRARRSRPWRQRAAEWGHSFIPQHQLSVPSGPGQKAERAARDAAEVSKRAFSFSYAGENRSHGCICI